MIKINLLTVEEPKVTDELKKVLMVYVMMVIGLIALSYLIDNTFLKIKINNKNAEIKKSDDEIKRLKNEVSSMEIKRQGNYDLVGKAYALNFIEDSRRNTVKVLRDFQTSIPKEQAWLLSLDLNKDGSWSLQGMGKGNDTVANTLDNLKNTQHLLGVYLVKSEKKILNNIELMAFQFAGQTKLLSDVNTAVETNLPTSSNEITLRQIGETLTRVSPSFKPLGRISKEPDIDI